MMFREIAVLRVVTFLVFIIASTDARPYKNGCRGSGLRVPNKHGTCPSGYGLRSGCCELCTRCPRGKGTPPVQETQCFTDCVDCPVGFFNDRPRARICTPCSCCEDYHRTTLKDCTPSSNAKCSKCNDGYAKHKVTGECEKSSSPIATTTESSEKKTSVKMRTASGWDEGVDEVTTIVIGEPGQTENWAKALEQPDSGIWSFTNVIVYVFIAIICIIVAAVGVMLVTVWKNRSNKRTHNTDNETTGSTFGDYVIDDITSEKIQMLLPPISSDNENTPTRPPIVCQRSPTSTSNERNNFHVDRLQCAVPVYSRIPDDANTNMNRDGDGDRPAHDLRDGIHNENSGSPVPQHRELHEDNLNRGVDVHPANVNGSRGRTLDTANRNIHEAGCSCGHCQDTTCPSCQQVVRVSNPSEETSGAPGVMGLPARENGRRRSQSTIPSHLCPDCSALVSSGTQLLAGRQEDGEASPREFDRISEAQLEESKTKVISDIPLGVRKTVCHCLDGEYRALTNGRVTFAIEMNISEVEAREAKDADTILLKLLTQRVPVYKVLKALDKIERDDAVHVIAGWLQHIEHS